MLQDKRYKNRELQVMRMLDHTNVLRLKHCFYSTTEKDDLYLNLVLEYVPETVYRVSKHYVRMRIEMGQPFAVLFLLGSGPHLSASYSCHIDSCGNQSKELS